MSLLRVRTVVLTAGALLASGLGTAGPASAAVVVCGATIVDDTELEEDVQGCTNHGIVIGADGITLDLNGHTVSGTPATGDGAGVYLVGRMNVTVTGGKVSQFDAGVLIEGGSGNIVRDLVVKGNVGVNAPRPDGAAAWGDGILVRKSQNNKILGNTVDENGPFSGIALAKSDSIDASGNLVDDNTVRDNATAAYTDGIRVEVGTTGNFISNNTVEGSALDGIALFFRASDNSLTGNTVRKNGFVNQSARRGDGIIVFNEANNNNIRGNTVMSNAANGIQIRGPSQTREGASANNIVDNDVKNNSKLSAIPNTTFGDTFDMKDTNLGCGTNFWSDNWKNPSVTRNDTSCIQ